MFYFRAGKASFDKNSLTIVVESLEIGFSEMSGIRHIEMA